MDTQAAAHIRRTDVLFEPVRLGPLTLPNRIVMAPLTRSRAGTGDVPHALNARYYTQRASAGLIVSEATNISQQGKGYAYTPGIYTDAQVEGWRLVTSAVHAAGGRIFCQLWHVGRISHPDLQPGGALPVAPSAIRPEGQAFTETGMQPHVEPHALTVPEIGQIVADYAHAAACARRAGFDGVEVHAANGYLIDQFMKSKTNQRTDQYGGTVENRIRFLGEVLASVATVWPAGQIGVRLAPATTFGDIDDADPQETFGGAVAIADQAGLAYIHVIEGETGGARDAKPIDYRALRRAFRGLYMANNGYTPDLAIETLVSGDADLIAFGRPYIANPDLPARIRQGAPLAVLNPNTLYGGGEAGYTDYPPYAEPAAA